VGVKVLANKADDFIHQLYIEMFKKLVRTACFRIRDYHAAEDIAQDVFVLAHKMQDDLVVHPNPKGWLFDTLNKKLMHELRARTRFIASLEKLEAKLLAEQSENNEIKSDKFDHLTQQEFDMLKMVYNDGFTIKMVAEKLGLTYETCRRQIQRAKDKVRNCEL